jgi:hypothetical protein
LDAAFFSRTEWDRTIEPRCRLTENHLILAVLSKEFDARHGRHKSNCRNRGDLISSAPFNLANLTRSYTDIIPTMFAKEYLVEVVFATRDHDYEVFVLRAGQALPR